MSVRSKRRSWSDTASFFLGEKLLTTIQKALKAKLQKQREHLDELDKHM